MTLEGYKQAFERALAALPGDDGLASLRQRAKDHFLAQGMPDPRHEDWRYTRLDRLLDEGLAAAAVPSSQTDLNDLALEGTRGGRLLFNGGRSVAVDVGGLDSVQVESLVDRWQQPLARISVSGETPSLTALNTAWFTDGMLVKVPAGAAMPQPAYCLYVDSAGGHAQARLSIEVGAGAKAHFIVHYRGQAGPGWTNAVIDVSLGRGATLELERLQEHGPDHHHTERLSATLEADSKLRFATADLGGELVRNDIGIALRAPGAAVELYGLFLAGRGQHIDNHTRIDHEAADTRSMERFRGIAAEGGRGVFNGKVIVRQDAQRIDAQQQSNNLLLGDRCEIDTKPELEIYADDVKCSHGATVGQLDEDQLFYLQTRGIDAAEGRRLLTLAFANTAIQRFHSGSVQNRIDERLRQILTETPIETS